MFTGLIEEVGYIQAIQAECLTIRCQKILEDLALGDSICVDGVCLTVIQFGGGSFTAQVSTETLRRSNLGERSIGSVVNLERALRVGGKVGGHFVSGHIDGVGTLQQRQRQGAFWEMTFYSPPACRPYLAPKGSIAVNGVSLTVAYCGETDFTVAVIPYSLEQTNLLTLAPGGSVNLEGDILAKYVERMLHPSDPHPNDLQPVDGAFLQENGFL